MIENAVVSYEELGQGRFRKEISLKPIHYFRDGLWRNIGNVLGNSGDPSLSIGSNELFDFRIRSRLSGNAPVVHIGKGNNMVRYTPLDTANTDGIVTGNSVVYPEAWANADLKITVAGHIIRKDILLRAGHPQSFSFRIDEKSNLSDDLVGSEFYITRPYLYKDGKFPIYLDWAKTSQGGKLILTVTLPVGNWAGWTLDPTYTSQPNETDGTDTYVLDDTEGMGGLNFGTDGNMSVAYGDDGDYYSYEGCCLVKFNLSTIPAGSTVDSASLYLRCLSLNGTNSHSIYRSLRAWSESQATYYIYSTGNNWGTNACKNATTDYDNNALATFTPAVNDNTITLSASLIQAMIPSGSFTNNGFVIHKLTWTSTFLQLPGATYKASAASTASYRPKLTIVYTEGGGSIVKPAYYYAQQ